MSDLTRTTGLDLKLERVRARVTATDVAQRMGVSRQRVSQIESFPVVNPALCGRYRSALSLAADDENVREAA